MIIGNFPNDSDFLLVEALQIVPFLSLPLLGDEIIKTAHAFELVLKVAVLLLQVLECGV
jgi:hypothetical protein